MRSSPADAELVTDVLWSLGAVAVGEEHVAGGVELVTAFVDDGATDAALSALRHRGLDVAVREVDEAEYLDAWRPYAQAVRVGERLLVRPPWVTEDDSRPDDCVVVIDPGRAFGSGAHATTRLVLERLVTLGPSSVLDVGCGSGVLAVVAACLGATTVDAIDIELGAVEATAANALRNDVHVDVSARPLAEVAGPYDLVLANLLAPVLVDLAPDLVRVVAPGGRLVASGLLAGRWRHVADALAPLAVERVNELEGWVALTLSA